MARAIVTAMESSRDKFTQYNVCTGKETTVKELANVVIGLFQAPSKVVHGPAREGDILKSVCNPAKAKKEIGFEYEYAIEKGLAATRDWFLNA